MIIEFGQAIEMASVGAELWKQASWLKRKLRWVVNRIIKGELKIVIFGAGGTGKSTLKDFLLHDQKSSSKYASEYKESTAPERDRIDIKGDQPCWIIALPGQGRRVKAHWPEFLREISTGKIWLIINVVAYGYHSFGSISYKDTEIYKQHSNISVTEFVELWRKDRLIEELNLMKELVPHINCANGVARMITLVTKQDLWWKQRQDVANYYMNGDYDRFIENIKTQRGQQHFIHEYLSASLAANNFRSGTHEDLAYTTAGYEQIIQQAHLVELANTISKIVKG